MSYSLWQPQIQGFPVCALSPIRPIIIEASGLLAAPGGFFGGDGGREKLRSTGGQSLIGGCQSRRVGIGRLPRRGLFLGAYYGQTIAISVLPWDWLCPNVTACWPFNPRLHSFPVNFFAFLEMGWILLAISVDGVYDIGVGLPYASAAVIV